MVSSCDRRIGDVPAASAMASSDEWLDQEIIGNYRFAHPARVMNVGNQYQSRYPTRSRRPAPPPRRGRGGKNLQFGNRVLCQLKPGSGRGSVSNYPIRNCIITNFL